MSTFKLATRTRIDHGVELAWERRERYGPTFNEQLQTWSDEPPKGTVIAHGMVFVELSTLEELLEVDHSMGMGGAYLCSFHEGMALEQAGLARQETRGGYYTTDEQRGKLRELIDALYEQMEAK